MKDLIESAMMKAAEMEDSESVSDDIFEPPKFLYVGCGARGIDRVKSEINSNEDRTLDALVTTVAVPSNRLY